MNTELFMILAGMVLGGIAVGRYLEWRRERAQLGKRHQRALQRRMSSRL